MILAYFLSKSVLVPLLGIKRAIKDVENNNLDTRVKILSNDEFGDVAEGFNLEAGPQIGFLLSAEIIGEDIKDEMESIDFGMNLGASYDFSEKLFAQARYNIGLSNVAKDSGDEKIQNSVISLSMGYRF